MTLSREPWPSSFGVPETFFIDPDGMVRPTAIGEISDRQLEAGIAAITTTEET